MESIEQNDTPQYSAQNILDEPANERLTYPPRENSPWFVLFVLAVSVVVGMLLSGLLTFVVGYGLGYDVMRISDVLSGNSTETDATFLRLSLLIQHLFLFFLPAVFALWVCYKQKAFQAAALDKRPLSISIGLSVIWLLASMAFIQYSYQINKAITLPKWMMANETDVKKTLETIFSLKGFAGAFVNTLLIGVMPAISEELLFRGVIQRQLGRLLNNDHAQVWITAAIFSAIHFQFQGFLPRMFLGALLGYMLVWSRSLWVPVIVHGLNNGMQVLALYALDLKPHEMEKLEEGKSLHWAVALASLVGSILLGRYFYQKHRKGIVLDNVFAENDNA
jgi:uncharacterized protein